MQIKRKLEFFDSYDDKFKYIIGKENLLMFTIWAKTKNAQEKLVKDFLKSNDLSLYENENYLYICITRQGIKNLFLGEKNEQEQNEQEQSKKVSN
jgi:mRNA degradation ribonuclease J1/J2